MSENYLEIIKQDKVYPIIRCKEPEQAVEISKALVEGGIRVLEINVENPSLYGAISEVSKFANVCAGGIITSLQADAAFASGAKLIASPIFQMNMVKISKNKRVPFIENILRQMPFLSLMPMGNIKLSEVVTYIKTGAAAVGVGRDFYLGFTPKEITARTKEIIKEVKDFSEWIQK